MDLKTFKKKVAHLTIHHIAKFSRSFFMKRMLKTLIDAPKNHQSIILTSDTPYPLNMKLMIWHATLSPRYTPLALRRHRRATWILKKKVEHNITEENKISALFSTLFAPQFHQTNMLSLNSTCNVTRCLCTIPVWLMAVINFDPWLKIFCNRSMIASSNGSEYRALIDPGQESFISIRVSLLETWIDCSSHSLRLLISHRDRSLSTLYPVESSILDVYHPYTIIFHWCNKVDDLTGKNQLAVIDLNFVNLHLIATSQILKISILHCNYFIRKYLNNTF